MTCSSCVSKVQNALTKVKGVSDVLVQLESPQGTLEINPSIPTSTLQSALSDLGKYTISDDPKTLKKPEHHLHPVEESDPQPFSLSTYKPLFLIVLFIAGTTILAQYPFTEFSWMKWTRHFMAGFFIVFAFFKLLNIQGFSDSYRMYDIIAAKWTGWGKIYPFVELGLGILFLTNSFPLLAGWATLIVLGVSSIGVIQSNLNKRKIKCACLGDVFNLPMSTVTIVEDLSMVVMAGVMLLMG